MQGAEGVKFKKEVKKKKKRKEVKKIPRILARATRQKVILLIEIRKNRK